MTETITVEKVNKYGVRVNGKQYNYSKKYSGESLAIGSVYDADVFTSESGAKYINSAVRSIVLPAPSTTINTGPTINAGDDRVLKTRTYKERDFEAEGKGKTLCALYVAAFQSPFLAGSATDDEFKQRIDGLVSYAFSKIFPNA